MWVHPTRLLPDWCRFLSQEVHDKRPAAVLLRSRLRRRPAEYTVWHLLGRDVWFCFLSEVRVTKMAAQ